MALKVDQIGILFFRDIAALEFAANRAGRTAKVFSNGSDGAQVSAHGHDDGALLGN